MVIQTCIRSKIQKSDDESNQFVEPIALDAPDEYPAQATTCSPIQSYEDLCRSRVV